MDVTALLVALVLSAAIIWVCFFAKGAWGETLRTLFFLGLAVWTVISGVVSLVQWFRMWKRMTPEQRVAFKESRKFRWKRKTDV